MSEFTDCIVTDRLVTECRAFVRCDGCGQMEWATDQTQVDAFRRLDLSLDRQGWRCYSGKAYCPTCVFKEARE